MPNKDAWQILLKYATTYISIYFHGNTQISHIEHKRMFAGGGGWRKGGGPRRGMKETKTKQTKTQGESGVATMAVS